MVMILQLIMIPLLYSMILDKKLKSINKLINTIMYGDNYYSFTDSDIIYDDPG